MGMSKENVEKLGKTFLEHLLKENKIKKTLWKLF